MMTVFQQIQRAALDPPPTLFAILAANSLALNLEKCVFALSELDFLGHRISAAGVAPLRDNVQVFWTSLNQPTAKPCKDFWV